MEEKLRKAKDLAKTHPDEAMRICNEVLEEGFDTKYGQMALFMLAYLMLEAERYGLAYHLYQRCAQIQPDRSEIYSNMGMCLEDVDPKEALRMFQKASKLNPKNALAYANEGLLRLQTAKPKKCIELCDKALEIDPKLRAATHNKGLAKLMLRDWSGWNEYSDTLGVKHRQANDYGLPDWNGEPGKLLVYGEQGVGDEIMFASMLPDLMKDHEIVFDTDKRLKHLFNRTFDCPVYGTRFCDESPIRNDHDVDYQVAIGQLGAIYRSKGEYPGTSYLKTDADMDLQWRALFDSFPGKKIGIAWTGGCKNTGQKKRSMTVDDFKSLFNDQDTFISLEYNPVETAKLEQYGIKSYQRVTGKGLDIDPLASLISQLDVVVTVCTTVVYIAGALGIPCYVLTPSEPSYRYHADGDFPWYDSVKLIRQKKTQPWINVVQNLKEQIDVKNLHRNGPKRDDSLSRVRAVNS